LAGQKVITELQQKSAVAKKPGWKMGSLLSPGQYMELIPLVFARKTGAASE